MAGEIIIDGLLKDTYFMKEVISQLNQATLFLDKTEKTSKYITSSGRAEKFPIEMGGEEGISFRPFGSPLPAASPATVPQSVVDLSRLFLQVQISIDEMERSRREAGAFAEIFGFKMESVLRESRRYLNRNILTGSGAGDITRIGDAQTAQTTVPVDNASSLRIGQLIEIWNKGTSPLFTDATFVANAKILNVDLAGSVAPAGKVTLSVAVTTAATSISYIFTAGAKGSELLGFRAAIDDGSVMDNYLGISRKQFGLWKSLNQTAAAPRQINDANLLPAWSILKKASQDKWYALTTYELMNSYATNGGLTSLKRFVDEKSLDLKGGYRGIEFQDQAIFADEQAMPDEVAFLVEKMWQIHQTDDLKWIKPGGEIMQWIQQSQFYVAAAYWFLQVVCIRPNAQVRVLKLK